MARAYIANQNDGTVSVIDTTTDTIIATIPVGLSPFGVTVDDVNAVKKVYVTNGSSDTVSVIDALSNTVIATVPVGSAPLGLAITPDKTKVYVMNGSNNPRITVIDTSTNTPSNPVPNTGIVNPFGAVASPDNVWLYITTNTFKIIHIPSNTVTATITLPGGALRGLDVTPDGNYVYAAAQGADVVYVIDVNIASAFYLQIVATISVGADPFGVAITPNGLFTYVTNLSDDTVSVIRNSDNTVIATIPVQSQPTGVSITPDGLFVYVNNQEGDTTSVISTATNTVTNTIVVGDRPVSLGKFIGNLFAPLDLIVTKSFSSSSIRTGGRSTLTITVTNPNDFIVTGISFTDVYPAGVINATPTNISATSGTPAGVAGGNSLSWTNLAGLGAGESATITIDVTSNIVGTYNNTTGPVIGMGASSAGASATLIVTKKRPRGFGGALALPAILPIARKQCPANPTTAKFFGVTYYYSHSDENSCYFKK